METWEELARMGRFADWLYTLSGVRCDNPYGDHIRKEFLSGRLIIVREDSVFGSTEVEVR